MSIHALYDLGSRVYEQKVQEDGIIIKFENLMKKNLFKLFIGHYIMQEVRNSVMDGQVSHKSVYRNKAFHKHGYISKLSDIDFSVYHPGRGGAIIYTCHNGQTLVGFGKDKPSGELTDFGGGISYKRDGCAVSGILREFGEESLGIFGTYDYDRVKDCWTIYNHQMIIIFIYMPFDPALMQAAFREKVDEMSHDSPVEVSDIVWCDKDMIKAIIAGATSEYTMYNRVRHLIENTGTDRIMDHLRV